MKKKKKELYWLSFADETGLLGECFVEESDFLSAIRKTHKLGINPGGQVAWFGFEDGMESKITPELKDRLIKKPELMALFPGVYKVRPGELH